MLQVALLLCVAICIWSPCFAQNPAKIDAVVLTTGKDTRVFLRSIKSGLQHLVDVNKFYIICPNPVELRKNLGPDASDRLVFVDEKSFPFNFTSVADVMVDAVIQKGLYPISGGKSEFERSVYGRLGWFLQQILKLYAGKICKLDDFVLLDSDIIWFKDIKFIKEHVSSSSVPEQLVTPYSKPYAGNKYYYTASRQYHPAYIATLAPISGVPLYDFDKKGVIFRSGITHHIVIVKSVLEDLIERSERKHGIPFWQVCTFV